MTSRSFLVVLVALLAVTMAVPTVLVPASSATRSASAPTPGSSSSGLLSSAGCVYPAVTQVVAVAYIGASPEYLSFPGDTVTGDQILVISNAINDGSLATFVVNDSEGSTYSVVADSNIGSAGVNYAFYAWKATVPFSEPDTINVSWTGASVLNDSIVAYEVSGGYGIGFGSEVIGSDPIVSVSAPICSIGLATISEVGSPTWGTTSPVWTVEVTDNSYANEYVESDLGSTAPPGWMYTSYPPPSYSASYIMAEVGYVGGPIPAPDVPSGIFSTLCGSWNDRNASECNPGAPNGTAFYFPPASANLYDTASPGYVQVNPDQYDTTPGPYESYLNYDGTLWLYYGGTWYNWTSSALDSTIDAAVNTPPLCKYTCFSEIDSVAVTYVPSYVTFGVGNLSIIVSWYNVSCPGYPTSGCYDPNQVDNESDWLTVITSNVDLSSPSVGPNFGSASVATLSGKEVTYPDGWLYPKRPFIQNGCGTGTSAAYDPARGLAYFSFEESSCLFAVWFSIDTTGVINDVNTSVGFAGLAIYAPRVLVYDSPDEALLSGNDTYLYILNSTGTWTNTTQAFSLTMNSRTDRPYLSGPTTYGALFIGLNTKTDIWLFSYAYTGGRLVKVPIKGPVPPYPIGAHDYGFAFQGGTYDNEGLVTLMVGCAHWVNSYGGYCSAETFSNATYLLQIGFPPAAPSIVSVTTPGNLSRNELDVGLSLPSAGSYPYTNATLYYGTNCHSLSTSLSAVAEGYGPNLSTSGFTWNVYHLVKDTTYCFVASLWNIFGQGNRSGTDNGTTIGGPPAPEITYLNAAEDPVVEVSLPYTYCGLGCNLYNLTNVTVFYSPSNGAIPCGPVSVSLVLQASWNVTYHSPNEGLNWQGSTTMYLSGLEPKVDYCFSTTDWNVGGQSTFSTNVSGYVPPYSISTSPPVVPRPGLNSSLPFQNSSNVTSPLSEVVVLNLGAYTTGANGLDSAAVSWTNTRGVTFTYEFALQAIWLNEATELNLTANGAKLTPTGEYGLGNSVLYVYPGSVVVKNGSTVAFAVTFVYNPPSPLSSTIVVVNGNALTAASIFLYIAVAVIGAVLFLTFGMRRTSPISVIAVIVLFLTVGMELFV